MKTNESIKQMVAGVTLLVAITVLALIAAGATGAVIAVAGFWAGIVVSEFIIVAPVSTDTDAPELDHT